MKTVLLALLFPLSSALLPVHSFSQLYPSESKAVVLIVLRSFDDVPIAKANVNLKAGEKNFPGVTNKEGNAEILVPIGVTYSIDVDDSLNYSEVVVPSKAWQQVRHKVYYHGGINGKMLPIPQHPKYMAMKPKAGTARTTIGLSNRDNDPLPDEEINLIGPSGNMTQKTDANGNTTFILQTGTHYIMKLKYNAKAFDIFIDPVYYGTGEAKFSFIYEGSKAIEQEILMIHSEQDTVVKSSVISLGNTMFSDVAVRRNTYVVMEELATGTGGKLLVCNLGQEVVAAVEKILTDEIKPGADVFVLVDVSGSMTNNIIALKDSLEDVLNELAGIKKIRIGVAGFDAFITDGMKKDVYSELNTDPTKAMDYVQSLQIFGGNEMVYDACAFAIDKPYWTSSKQRAVILLGDEPPQVNPATGIDEDDVIQKCNSKGIQMNLYPVLIGGY